jgi:hypothetical protein
MDTQGDAVDASTFQLAKHNGLITIEQAETGRRQTFQIRTIRGGALRGERVVQVLVGPDPDVYQSWATFGLVQGDRV